MSPKIKVLPLFATTLLALCAANVPSSAQNSNTPKKEILVGRVLAEVQRPYGAGVGPLWQLFIFGVESRSDRDKIKPVLVAYLFHNYKLDPPLREPFFDHSNLYALAVVREAKCDEGVSTLSIVENETETGKPLPPSPGIWHETTVLFRPVVQKELDLIEQSEFTAFPPRLPDQPIFYPVLNEGYATQIARDWNAKHNLENVGYVTRFRVRDEYLKRHKVQTVGGSVHQEYWIPAEELSEFNLNIVGRIEVVSEYRNEKPVE